MFAQNQWLRLSVVLLIALLAKVAWGAPATKSSVAVPKLEASAPLKPAKPVEFSAGPGAMAWSSSRTINNASVSANATGVVTNLGVLFAVGGISVPLHIGVDFGVGFLSVDPITNATYVRLAPTVVYKVELPKAPSVHPYFGLTIGPNVTVLSSDVANATTTKVYFEGLTRLGVGFDFTDNLGLAAESKVGILGGDVIFMPSVLLTFSI